LLLLRKETIRRTTQTTQITQIEINKIRAALFFKTNLRNLCNLRMVWIVVNSVLVSSPLFPPFTR